MMKKLVGYGTGNPAWVYLGKTEFFDSEFLNQEQKTKCIEAAEHIVGILKSQNISIFEAQKILALSEYFLLDEKISMN